MRIADIMEKNVIAVDVAATIEEAALLMCNHKIGGMPVISSVGAVVGVITETDIFKTFVDVMGLCRRQDEAYHGGAGSRRHGKGNRRSVQRLRAQHR